MLHKMDHAPHRYLSETRRSPTIASHRSIWFDVKCSLWEQPRSLLTEAHPIRHGAATPP